MTAYWGFKSTDMETLKIPKFDNETDEANWVYENREGLADAFLRAAKEGRARQGTVKRRGITPATTPTRPTSQSGACPCSGPAVFPPPLPKAPDSRSDSDDLHREARCSMHCRGAQVGRFYV